MNQYDEAQDWDEEAIGEPVEFESVDPTVVISVRIGTDDLATIEGAANKRGEPISTYLRESALLVANHKAMVPFEQVTGALSSLQKVINSAFEHPTDLLSGAQVIDFKVPTGKRRVKKTATPPRKQAVRKSVTKRSAAKKATTKQPMKPAAKAKPGVTGKSSAH